MRWDAVIAGGGASGLSLACHLAAGGWGERRALVEHTRFGGGAGPVDTGGALTDYLERVVGVRSYRVVRREGGVLPLRVPAPRPGAGHVLPIGVRGGMLKASTGYAHARIQRDSAAIASSLVRPRASVRPAAGAPPAPVPRRRPARRAGPRAGAAGAGVPAAVLPQPR